MASYVPGHIRHVPTDKLAVICAGLAREGICFNVTPENDAGTSWDIELTGGY